jgi:hypothetical protein
MSFPFRVDPSGVVATVEQGSDRDIEEQLAVALLTSPGERIQVPTFGCADPAFIGFEMGNLTRHLADFGPDVEVVEVGARRRGDDREELTVCWARRGGESA